MKPLLQQLALVSLLLLAVLVSVHAGSRVSASYSIATDVADAGGKRTTSASYTNDGSAGGAAALATVAAPVEVAKSGYIGQLYEITGLAISGASPNVNEGATDQLTAWQSLDDASLLPVAATSVTWSVQTGPLASINANGLATAGIVYQNTAATAQGSYGGYTGAFVLTILNTNLDDFGAYAGDQIDDSWQVQYFGQPPNANAGPNVDFDRTGQTNLFKFIAGLNPLDGSRFILAIASVPAQPGQKNLSFNPIFAGRTYTVTSSSSLGSGSYSPINSSLPSDNGTTRTVTDLSATGAAKFYRVEITKP